MGVNGAFFGFSGAFWLPDFSIEVKVLDGGAKERLIKFESLFKDCCCSFLSNM